MAFRPRQECHVNLNLNARHPAGVFFRRRAPHPGARIRDALHPSAADHLFHLGLVNLAVSRRGGRAHFSMTLLNPATDMSHTTVLMLHPTCLAAEPSLEPLR
ncbi:hypothetical protein [Ralstonia pseudosolanacearum]